MATIINTAENAGPVSGSNSFIHKNQFFDDASIGTDTDLSLIHISEPTRPC